MNDIKEQLNSVNFEEVLNHLWIKTFNKWIWLKGLYEWQRKTRWWALNTKENLINDFSWKWRAKWDVISFLEMYLNLEFHEVLEYWKSTFWLIDYNKEYKQKKDFAPTKPLLQDDYTEIDVKSKFNLLENLTKIQIDYINSRWIDYEKIKDVVKNNNWIACWIYNEKWQIISINTRSISEKKFYILKWTQSKWVYMWKINKDIKKIYVVEWMFDFLSLYQFWVNVIWLKSVNDWIEVVKEFYKKWYDITIIPDNDENWTWKTILNELTDIKYNLFDLFKYEVKDINELLTQSDYWVWIIEIIEEEKTKWWHQEEFEIIEYSESLIDWIKELDNTDPNNAIQWWYKELDDRIWYIFTWQLILVWWTTWTWKSTFVWEIAKNISMQGNLVLKFTLEDRLEDNKKRELFNEINKTRKLNWLVPYPYNDFMCNNIKNTVYKQEKEKAIKTLSLQNKNIREVKRLNERQIDINNLEIIIKKWIAIWCKLIVLDHLQEFKIEWDKERQDLKIEEMMYKIKNLTRKYNIAIILIAHFKKVNWKPDENSFKDSIAITQVANKVLILHRDKLNPQWLTDLMIFKNREKADWTWIIQMNFNFDEMKYTNIKTELQLKKEDEFIDL